MSDNDNDSDNNNDCDSDNVNDSDNDNDNDNDNGSDMTMTITLRKITTQWQKTRLSNQVKDLCERDADLDDDWVWRVEDGPCVGIVVGPQASVQSLLVRHVRLAHVHTGVCDTCQTQTQTQNTIK
jgi:hypothetical protein